MSTMILGRKKIIKPLRVKLCNYLTYSFLLTLSFSHIKKTFQNGAIFYRSFPGYWARAVCSDIHIGICVSKYQQISSKRKYLNMIKWRIKSNDQHQSQSMKVWLYEIQFYYPPQFLNQQIPIWWHLYLGKVSKTSVLSRHKNQKLWFFD